MCVVFLFFFGGGELGGLCFCVFDCLHARFFSHVNFVCLRAYVCVICAWAGVAGGGREWG